MAILENTEQLSNLYINKVDSLETFNDMVEQGQVNENELYLVEGNESGSGSSDLGLSVIDGVLCMTYDGESNASIIENGTISIWNGGNY